MRGEFILNLDKSSYRSFSTEEEAEEWGNKYYGKWSEEYKTNIINLKQIFESSGYSAIEEYCGHDYKNINSILWDERLDNASDLYKIKINTMLLSIALAPRIPENIVVYRGVSNSFIRELKSDRKKDFWKRYKGFLSTSLVNLYWMKDMKLYYVFICRKVYTAPMLQKFLEDLKNKKCCFLQMLF